jgi:hypothetical protein
MNGIQPQAVEVVLGGPESGVVGKKLPHAVRPGAVEVEGVAPGRAVLIGEIGPVLPDVVALRPHVIVHHVEENGNAAQVALLHQPLQSSGVP